MVLKLKLLVLFLLLHVAATVQHASWQVHLMEPDLYITQPHITTRNNRYFRAQNWLFYSQRNLRQRLYIARHPCLRKHCQRFTKWIPGFTHLNNAQPFFMHSLRFFFEIYDNWIHYLMSVSCNILHQHRKWTWMSRFYITLNHNVSSPSDWVHFIWG